MLKLKLTDTQDTVTYSLLQVPLTTEDITGTTDVTTLDGNVYTDYIYDKKTFKHKWAWLSLTDYKKLRGFYDRQFTNYKYPTMELTEPDGTVTTKVVRMEISEKNMTSNCGTIEDVTITLRESHQL